MFKFKSAVLVLFILFFFIILSPTFAEDNQTDIYFDADSAIDGNGTFASPFKNFTVERISENSTVHFASGEYDFDSSKTVLNITFHGSGSDYTVLNGNGKVLTVSGVAVFSNLTLKNFTIVNAGNLTAKNTIFTELMPSHLHDDSINYYGGAIFAEYNKNIYLEKCRFTDNSAQYGGAIYAKGGCLTIIHSLFCNNTATYMGGAILAESGVRIIINNTEFILDKSLEDGGGAIYMVSSNLNADNINVTNCSATFGAGITALRSNFNLNNSIFKDNAAGFDGGAIYQYYGSIVLNSSKFISNRARNGGGIFTNVVNVLNITSNQFIGNTALNRGGAIYSFLKNTYNLTGNLFENNDVYNTTEVNLTIGDGNYIMYNVTPNSNISIPSLYDLRKLGYVSPVKDQMQGGNCWAFAAIAALESCILKASGDTLDLSEENMKNLMAWYSDYGRNIRDPNWGGDNDMPVAYLTSWLGPVDDSEDVYDDKSQLSPVLKSLMHVQNVLFLKRNNYTDNDAIKRALMNYGAVATNMYYANSLFWDRSYTKICYYYHENLDMPTNHGVTIVGWDDSVDIVNAPGKGAWIVRNSWGSSWLSQYGHDGYFYVSYYDYAFARPGSYASYTFILNDTQHFDKNYQYDVSGITDYFYVNQSNIWFKNAFNATDNEFLSGVSTYFNQNTSWELYIFVNSKLQLVQNGSNNPGYYTINLKYPIPLVEGDVFEILFNISTPGDAGFPISESVSTTKLTYKPGVSFVSFNGLKFFDLYDFEHSYPYHSYATQVACIKGFTQLITLKSKMKDLNITYDSYDLFNITLTLTDENNNSVKNGNVTFTINGANYSSQVSDCISFLQIPFKLGINNISWSFTSPNYHVSYGMTTYEVFPIHLDMNVTVTQIFNNATVIFTFSQNITENMIIWINGVNSTVKVVNGTYCLNFTSLEYGEYNISARLDREVYDSKNSTSFFVNVKRTHLEMHDFQTYYNSGALYSVQLIDIFNTPVSNREIIFLIGSERYVNKTDKNGIAVIPLSLKNSLYALTAVFEGDEVYITSQNSSTVTVKSTVILPDLAEYSMNSNYEVSLLNKDGSSLKNTLVTLEIGGKKYNILTDGNGKLTFTVPFTSGNFRVNIINPDTQETVSQDIVVVKRITENRDMSFYYGSAPVFKVRVCDDNGKFVSGLNVKITVNGKSYNCISDKKGYASLKINLISGKYTITCEYKGFKVSNKITVKKTLITKNKKVKKGKTVKFTAKLLNKNGKALKGKKITFKIKGKTYKAKTNKKGIATVKIKNLKVGTYKIICTYSKLKSASKITVKK